MPGHKEAMNIINKKLESMNMEKMKVMLKQLVQEKKRRKHKKNKKRA